MNHEYHVHSVTTSSMLTAGDYDPKQLTEMLNWYAGQGWELVSTFSAANNHGGTRSLGFVFKRPRPQAQPPVQMP